MEPAENSDGTVRRIGRPFEPGQSGNPGGRPKGLAKAVRDASGGDPTMLVEGLLAIARGEGVGVNAKAVRPADQIRAYELFSRTGGASPRRSDRSRGRIPWRWTRSRPRSGRSQSSCDGNAPETVSAA